MKYRQLTKEQLSELHLEFSNFLATQQIDAKEWNHIKNVKPDIAEEELNVFSDLVWEGVLTKTNYLNHISDKHINLFQCNSKEIVRIFIKMNAKNKSFLISKDFDWFKNNPLDESIEYFKATKKYKKDRNIELFELIEMGSHISEGQLFTAIHQLIL